MSKLFTDSFGKSVQLGKELGSGGEGSVFEVIGAPGIVAKIYKQGPIPAEKSEKLQLMVTRSSSELEKIAAWPKATIRQSGSNQVCGIVMPRISGREIHELYSPAHRKIHFKTRDWRFLIHVARNCAAAFETFHQHGIVIGDVNQGNLFVNADGFVTLIDCDSFQMSNNGRVYLCRVGVPHYTPPELQRANLGQTPRNTTHDHFGLAVLIFHLLFMGRHPFAGRWTGTGDMPIENAIEQYLFAYAATSRSRMAPPLHSLLLKDIPGEMAKLFERAFSKGIGPRPTAIDWANSLCRLGKQCRKCADDPGHYYFDGASSCPWCEIGRTSGTNLFISVTIQSYVAAGPFDREAIWREIMSISSPASVVTQALKSASSSSGTNVLGAHLPSPPTLPPAPTLLAQPALPHPPQLPGAPERGPPPDQNLRLIAGFSAILCALMNLFGFVDRGILYLTIPLAAAAATWWVGLWVATTIAEWGWRAVRRKWMYNCRFLRTEWDFRRQTIVDDWKTACELLAQEWQQRCDDAAGEWQLKCNQIRRDKLRMLDEAKVECTRSMAVIDKFTREQETKFQAEIAKLSAAKTQLESLDQQKRNELGTLEQNAKQKQLDDYLDKHFIRDASIPNIGPMRVATLQAYGLETAADVIHFGLGDVPGFGETLSATVVAWARVVEQRFRYNASLGIPDSQRQVLEVKYQQRKMPQEAALRQGPTKLRSFTAATQSQWNKLSTEITLVKTRLMEAEAGLAAIDREMSKLQP